MYKTQPFWKDKSRSFFCTFLLKVDKESKAEKGLRITLKLSFYQGFIA
jgi:hypothetical protein